MAETPSGIDQTNDNRNSGRQHASPPSFPTSPTSNSQKPRLSKEFVELQSCPLPELAVDPECAPEPLSNLDKLDNTDHDDASTYPVVPVEPDVGDRRPSAVVYAEPDRSWISKHKSWVILGLIVAVIIMTGVTVGVVITERHNSSGGGGSSTSSAPAPPAVSTSISSRTTSPASSPVSISTSSSLTSVSSESEFSPGALSTSSSQTSTPSDCASANFVSKVSWMGIANAQGGWKVGYSAASDATACCSICHESQPKGCDGWAYMPTDGSPGTACNMITGYAGENSDSTCPSGYAGVTFAMDSSNASHVGGAGPCATLDS